MIHNDSRQITPIIYGMNSKQPSLNLLSSLVPAVQSVRASDVREISQDLGNFKDWEIQSGLLFLGRFKTKFSYNLKFNKLKFKQSQTEFSIRKLRSSGLCLLLLLRLNRVATLNE